jgi:aspartyl-tRNA(Asn)/glutamyl-tRNA(Gln) amidotransferase subunit B
MTKSAPEAAVAPEVLAKYETVIGLEVHVQLLTNSKIFCACANRFGDPPNTNVCPVCLGLPGTLPVLNKRAVELAVRASLALHCTVHEHSRFARKNYFYPDLPKGYQISQYELPLATNGWIEIDHDGEKKPIRIARLHLEEDAAKNLHEGFSQSDTKAYIDYNRCGTPLCEIVSEPDMRGCEKEAPELAYAYLTMLRQIMLYAGVSDVDMEEGSLRCDANVSVRLRGAREFGTKVEVKNLNSFAFLREALQYEIKRHITVLESGGRLVQETRLWDQNESCTVSMRSKEKAHDYRYFPEPDLLPVHVSSVWRDEVLRSLPELPADKRARLLSTYAITSYDADVLMRTPTLADYFEAVARAGAPAKTAANWIQTELLRRLNDSGKEIEASPVSPPALAQLINLIESGKITGAVAKKVFAIMFETGQDPSSIVSSQKLELISGEDKVRELLAAVLSRYLERLDQFHQGKTAVTKSLLGEAMKSAKGRVRAQEIQEELDRVLIPMFSTSTNTAAVVVPPDPTTFFVHVHGFQADPQPTEILRKAFTLYTHIAYPEVWLINRPLVAWAISDPHETKASGSGANEPQEIDKKED